ncbi:MAG: hypothetical protein ACRDRT_12500, partial [Pseudonocardiaceae bacterium]
QRLGIATVATVAWTTDQVLRRLIPERTTVEWSDATGALNLIERVLPAFWAGRRLSELDGGAAFRLVALTRGGIARLCGPELIGQEGDIVHLALRRDATDDVEARLAGPTDGVTR